MAEDKLHGVTILGAIGSGSFGNVMKCIFRGKECVVKKIPLSQNEYAFKSVISEYMVLSQMRHPRIVELVSFYQTRSHWNFVLEHMKNGSLRHILIKYRDNKWKFCQKDLLAMFLDILAGVKFLHSRGIIHRDLKPENILVDEFQRLKLADFGISKLMPSSEAANQTAIGTVTYMAPEVYLHKPYNKSIDIWALGIIFFEMAMITYPFSKADKARIMNPLLTFIPPKIDCARRNYSKELQDLLVLMLQRNPDLRCDANYIEHAPSVSRMFSEVKQSVM